jgi:hypothetical protein
MVSGNRKTMMKEKNRTKKKRKEKKVQEEIHKNPTEMQLISSHDAIKSSVSFKRIQ